MELNFTDEKYKKIAMESKGYSDIESSHKMSDAFMLLLKGVKEGDLSYICSKMQHYLKKGNINLTIDECYSITQGDLDSISVDKEKIEDFTGKSVGNYLLDLSYECIEEDGKHLGDNVIPNTNINTSSWISHSLYEAKAAQNLACALELDSEKAGILGLLHDYGRKYIHDFSHVTKGYEALVGEGWSEEARATITHSFINAGRCANCDPAEKGFYINEEGKPEWELDAKKDDITEVLENIKYDDYDMILNIADLMATDRGITSPYDRVQDVATRKSPDLKNRGYFLSEYINILIYVMEKVKGNESSELNNANALMDLETLNLKFKEVSEKFYTLFKSLENNSPKVTPKSIADADRERDLTRTEVGNFKEFIKKLLDKFKGKGEK